MKYVVKIGVVFIFSIARSVISPGLLSMARRAFSRVESRAEPKCRFRLELPELRERSRLPRLDLRRSRDFPFGDLLGEREGFRWESARSKILS